MGAIKKPAIIEKKNSSVSNFLAKYVVIWWEMLKLWQA